MAFVLAGTGWLTTANAQQRDAALDRSAKLAGELDFVSPTVPGQVFLPSGRGAILSEDFSDETFPSNGWSAYDLDGAGQEWVRETETSASPPASARHRFASGEQDGWLVTPTVSIPGDGATLSFVDAGAWMQDYVYNGVHVSTGSCDPADGEFVELAEIADTPGESGTITWRTEPANFDLGAYAGQDVCIAFVYQGDFAHAWLIDDVLVFSGEMPTPSIAVSPSSFDVSAAQGEEDVTRTLTVSNTGDATLNYSVGFQPGGDASSRPASNQSFTYTKQGQQFTVSTGLLERPGLTPRRTLEDGHLSFEDSEGFTLGFIGGQQGWSTVVNNTLQPSVTDAASSDGDWSLALSNHEGLGTGSNVAAFSPAFLYSNDIIRMSFDINVEATGGSDYQVLAQSPTQELVAIRMNFNWEGNLMILDEVEGVLGYQNVGPYDTGVWNTVDVELNKFDGTISYYLNDELIHEGVIYGADIVEQFVFLHDNWNAGESGYVDNVTIEGENSWLVLGSTGGSLQPGESEDITLTFDANFGNGALGFNIASYEGEITVLSNDPDNAEVTVPVTFTITDGEGGDSEALAYWNFNDPAAEGNPWPQPIASNLGDGAITYTFEAGIEDFGGTTVNALNEDEAGSSFSVQGATDLANNGGSFDVTLSTLGYEDIVFSYATRGTGSGFDSQLAEFSTDGGTTWTNLGDANAQGISDYFVVSYDLAEFTEADNAEELIIRVTLDGATTDTGNNRFDNIVVAGVEGDFPTPGELVFEPSPLVEELMAGETGTETVTITNTTDEAITYTFTQYAEGEGRALVQQIRSNLPTAQELGLQKGQRDPRVGQGFTPERGEGGPDAFGYEWIDSNEPGGPAFESIDISETGTPVTLVASPGCSFGAPDEGYAEISLPFNFSFYGQDYSSIYASANGFLTFQPDVFQTSCTFTNSTIPTATAPNALIAPLWFDMNGYTEGSILAEQLTDGRFVIQYEDWARYAEEGTFNTFQVILSPSGAIKYQYLDVNYNQAGFSEASIGVENEDGTVGLQVAYDQTYPEAELAVLISSAPTFITSVTPFTGTIPAGESVMVDVTFDATTLIGGTYEGNLTVEANGVVYDYPVVLEVTGVPGLTLDPIALDFGTLLVGESLTLETTATNTGTDVTTISDISVDNGDYTVDIETPLELTPGEEAVIAVTFTPTTETTIEGTLTVTSDAPDSPHTVTLTGAGAPPPEFVVAPTELTFDLEAGEVSEAQTVTLTNNGDGEGIFSITTTLGRPSSATSTGSEAMSRSGVQARLEFRRPDAQLAQQDIGTLRARVAEAIASEQRRTVTPGVGEVSSGRAPMASRPAPNATQNHFGGESSIAYGHDAGAGQFGSFDFQTPGIFTPIASIPASAFIGAGALGNDPEVAYQVDGSVLYEVNTATGVATEIGDLGVELSGMTYDPTTSTFYGIPFVALPGPTPLFEVDVETATLTEIGTGDYPTGIALAATPDGTLYTYDINADVLVQLDKTTGAGTVIGPIGFDANFGQGMTYDYVNDVMYMAAYNNGVGQPELRAVDLETGATTLVGPLGVAQMGWAGAPATGANFLVVTPESGTVEAGGSVDISVVADATELNGGTYEAALVITTNDPENPELVVDVTVNVTGAPGITIEPGSIDFGDVIDGNEATQEVEITNSGTDVLNVSDITVEGDAFSVDFDDAFSLGVGESEIVLVTFAPGGAGDYSGTLTVESNAPSSPDEVALTGTGLDQPTPEVDPTELTFEVQVGATASESFTLTNVGGDDAADLEYEISVAEARPAPTATTPAANARTANTTAANARTLSNLNKAANALRHATTAGRFGTEFTAVDGSTGSPLDSPIEVTGPPRALYRGGEVIITHSQSQEIIPLSGIACPTPPNSWFRVFDLSEFISGNLEVTSVDIGMEEVGPGGATVVNLYTLDGPLLNENLTLVSSAELVVSPADNLSIVNVPISGEFSADDVMVLEWAVPFAGVYFGGNELGQTGPTYIQAAACGATEPADLATLGDFPLNAWVANVHGNAGSSLVSVSPESGTIAPGDSDEITVTVDATDAAAGTYEFDVIIATNDPANPEVTVNVTVEVVVTPANEGDGVPTEFALSQNYPNPFAGATTIEYALPEAAHVTITVYDAVGRRIAVLVNEDLTTGYHKAEWDTRGLAAGVYLYRIEAGDYVRTKKMSLVR